MSWLTDSKFVGAISKAGGLGVLGINAGQSEPPAKTVEETVENMRREVHIAEVSPKSYWNQYHSYGGRF